MVDIIILITFSDGTRDANIYLALVKTGLRTR